jgi:hypothetical protein
MARVALLTMSDGRDFVARDLTGLCQEAEAAVAAALAAAGHQVERDSGTVTPPRHYRAARIAARLARKDLIRHELTAASR